MKGFAFKAYLLVITVCLLIFSSGAIAADQLVIATPFDYDYFGTAVGIDGDLAVVGAPNHDSATYATRASRVILFRKSGGVWSETDTLQANDSFEERYGTSVAISGDTIIVGAYETDVTIGEDDFIRAGAAYIYSPNGAGGWNVQQLIAPDPGGAYWFGYSVTIDGDIAVVGSPRNDSLNGAAYVFQRSAGVWDFVKKITTSDQENSLFGQTVSVSGTTLAVGAPQWDDGDIGGTGAVYIYERSLGDSENWGEVTRITSGSPRTYLAFGTAISLDVDTLAVGTYNSAEVYIYERDLNGDDNWGHRITLVPEDTLPGPGNTYGTALSLDDDLLAVGAYLDSTAFSGSGSVYFYYRDKDGTDAWGLVEKQLHPAPDVNDNQYFGYSVSLCTPTILVGAYGDDFLDNDGTADNRGAAYVLELCDQLGGDVDEDYVCYDSDNCPDTHNPDQSDVDGDDIGDACDLGDFDGDGLSDAEEYVFGSNPGSNDSDGDGLTDAEEYAFGSDPNSNDSDGDGLTDAQEFALGTNPTNPDTDGDSVLDGNEVDCESNPLDPESKCIRGMLWLLLLLEDD